MGPRADHGGDSLATLQEQRRLLLVRARARVWSVVALVCASIVLTRWGMGESHEGWLAGVRAWMLALAACGAALVALAWGGLGDGPGLNRSARAIRRVLLMLAFALLVVSVTKARLYEQDRRSLSLLVPTASEGSVIDVEGLVITEWQTVNAARGVLGSFVIREPGHATTLRVRRVRVGEEWQRATGTVRLVVAGAADTTRETTGRGSSVRVTGVFAGISPVLNPGDGLRDLFRAQADGQGQLRCSSHELLAPIDHAHWGDALRGGAARASSLLRARLQAVLNGAARDDERALLGALLLGERELDRSPAGDAYTRLGLSHILSISGFHLSVLALSLAWALRLAGDWGGLESVVLAGVLGVYASTLPADAPILRSVLMVLILLAVGGLGRRYDRLCVLGWIALALLALRPADVFLLGFQLSVGLTALLLWAGDSAAQALFGLQVRGLVKGRDATTSRGALGRVVRDGVSGAIAASALCWTVSLPWVAQATGLVSPVGLLASILLAPLFVVLLWVGYAALLVGLVLPGFAPWAGNVLSGLASLALTSATWLDSVAWSSVRVPPLPWWWALLACALLALGWRFWALWTRASRRIALVCAAGLALLLPVIVLSQRLPEDVALRLEMLAVGDGTCMVLRAGDDAMLWDAKAIAPLGATPRAAAILRELGAWRVRRVLISHPDIDHMGGLPELIEPLGVEEVLVSPRLLEQAGQQPNGGAAVLIRALQTKGVQVRTLVRGDSLRLGPARVTILSPPSGAPWSADNDHSLVALVEVGQANHAQGGTGRLLLTGDIGAAAIAGLNEVALPMVDVLELPHHGSALVEAIAWVGAHANRQLMVVQSTGPSRVDDPRWDGVREQLGTDGWLVTARDGCVRIDWRHDGTRKVTRVRSLGAE